MKKILQTMVLTLAMLTANAQQTYVPDDAFEDFLEANGMGNGISNDDYVTTASIDTVTVLNILYFLFPTNLIGIEDFTLLEELNCSDLQLSSLDVSQNNNLIKLDCADNLLVSLNVSQNSALSELSCWGNQLTSLDVSNNIALTYLDIDGNDITSINLSQNIALEYINCAYTQLSQLDVSQNILLTHLFCADNNITSLNVSNNPDLLRLSCEQNWSIPSLDVSNNTALTWLECFDNQITSLDVSNNIALTYLMCQDNQITSLDVSQSSDLIELSCGDNQLISLDVRNGNNNNFIYFKCDDNPNLTCINVDDANWSTTNWIQEWFVFDQQHYFSDNCPPSAIEEYNANRRLSKIVNIIGKEVAVLKENQIYFYIYDDGTVVKQLIIK
jgi:hypothetical protein